MKKIVSFIKLIDFQTVIVSILAVASAYLCQRFNLAADMPSGLIGIAIIFPIVFSINAAYKRREEALKYFASIRAHSLAIFYAHRDWTPDGDWEDARRVKILIEDLLNKIKHYFLNSSSGVRSDVTGIYEVVSQISKSHEKLREKKVPANEISRTNQYLRAIIIEFERMRNILYYRTPFSLRSYSFVFLNSFPILFGPYFAYLSSKYYDGIGYLVAILYSLVLVSLDNIQENLENPYDAIGEDDLTFEMGSDFETITCLPDELKSPEE